MLRIMEVNRWQEITAWGVVSGRAIRDNNPSFLWQAYQEIMNAKSLVNTNDYYNDVQWIISKW